jgi:stage II sporulation protein D
VSRFAQPARYASVAFALALLASALTSGPAIAQPAGGADPAPRISPDEPTFDVGLAWDLDSLRIEPYADVLKLYQTSDRGDRELSDDASRVEIRRAGETWEIVWQDSEGDLQAARLPALDTLWVSQSGDDAFAGRLRWRGKTWRGMAKVFVGPRGGLTIAMRARLETYLLGVVPGEIGSLSDDLLEAGRAQAIAARSYTLFYRGRRSDEGFDLYGTVEDQVYGPVETERPLATRVVQATSGAVALFRGQPIRANYCSTCGGITADVWEAWPTEPLDFLVSHRDRAATSDYCVASPHHRWQEKWSAKEFADNLARYGREHRVALPAAGVGQLVDVVVTDRSRSGRVWRLEVRTTTGVIVVPAHVLRMVLRRGGNPTAILRSTLFKIDVRRDPDSRRAIEVVASGAGSGHGVGLCQTGALGMARSGRSAEDILRHYYPGIEIRRQY